MSDEQIQIWGEVKNFYSITDNINGEYDRKNALRWYNILFNKLENNWTCPTIMGQINATLKSFYERYKNEK